MTGFLFFIFANYLMRSVQATWPPQVFRSMPDSRLVTVCAAGSVAIPGVHAHRRDQP